MADQADCTSTGAVDSIVGCTDVNIVGNKKSKKVPIGSRAPATKLCAMQIPFRRVYMGSSPRKYAYRHAQNLHAGGRSYDPTDHALPVRNLAVTRNNNSTPTAGLRTRKESNMHTIDPRAIEHDSFEAHEYATHDNGDQRPLLEQLRVSRMAHFTASGTAPSLFVAVGQPPLTPTTPTMGWQLEQLRVDMEHTIEHTRSQMVALQQGLAEQKNLIATLSASNKDMYKFIHVLSERLSSLEEENASLRQENAAQQDAMMQAKYSHARTPSNSSEQFEARGRSHDIDANVGTHNSTQEGAFEAVSRLQITENPRAAMRTVVWTPKANGEPSTPARTKGRPFTMLNKRKVHNLTAQLPPTYTQFPSIPLTDTEIVVYFYNSISRPAVSLRLYARGWGPAKIANVLNSHREIVPAYLRNTASVKCVTAQKRGREMFGVEWEEDLRDRFRAVDDMQATELLRITPDECEETLDIDILECARTVKKHPELEDFPGEYGIFSRCVMWAEEHERTWMLSQVHVLAQHLEQGTTPEPPTRMRSESVMIEDEETDTKEGGEENVDTDIAEQSGDMVLRTPERDMLVATPEREED